MKAPEPFSEMLTVGGKSNSLGRVDEVIKLVLDDQSRLSELYDCMFNEDAWVRMRAADAFEKICRVHPEWMEPYIDRFPTELANGQASIQWHLAQLYRQVQLSSSQRRAAMQWLQQVLATTDIDWIVAANAMETLVYFTKEGHFSVSDMRALLKIQQGHKSNAVIKRATKLASNLE